MSETWSAADIERLVASGIADERERIREALWKLHVDATTHGGWMPGWHKFADLLDDDGGAA